MEKIPIDIVIQMPICIPQNAVRKSTRQSRFPKGMKSNSGPINSNPKVNSVAVVVMAGY